MRTIRDRRNELSSELLRVTPLFSEGFSRSTGVNTSSLGTVVDVAFDREDSAMIKECAEKRQTDPNYRCGRRLRR
ncbi:hypothetical protein LJC57_08880 [Parabacteroides sp. OttesenSCG-928-G07]|nr:hypothetical protein [Parabacteroides sp. OttesenSCG-928-G07]